MLTDRLTQMLTAYVDGELNARQLAAVQRLLRQNAEARELLQRLQQDADRLAQLPRRNLPSDFSSQVLMEIGARGLRPAPVRRNATPGVPPWLGLAAAAAVLLVITSASYVYFAVLSLSDPSATTTQNSTSPGPTPPDAPTVVRNDQTVPVPVPELLPAPLPEHVAQSATPPPAPQGQNSEPGTPENGLESILTSPTPKMELFPQVADTKLALILSLARLDQAQARRELSEELRKDSGYRIELTCLETARAVDRLRATFQANGIRLLIDQLAQDRLKLKLRTNFALYVENVTADEVAKVLEQLAVEDKKSKPRRQFDKVILQRMTGEDHAEVSRLFGLESRSLKPRSPRDVDPQKPLSSTTAEQVEQALKGQSTRPTPGTSVVKPGERLAVVVPYNPVRPRATSAQVKQFLENRKDRQSNTLQVVLVLRGANG